MWTLADLIKDDIQKESRRRKIKGVRKKAEEKDEGVEEDHLCAWLRV